MKKTLLFACVSMCVAAVSAQTSLKVLDSKIEANGDKSQVVEDANGRIFKQLVKANGAMTPANEAAAEEEPSTVKTFYEGFEGWQDSFGLNWIPEGWSEKNTEANTPTEEQLSHNINNSWYVYKSSNLYQELTSDGVNEAFIHFAYEGQYGTTAAAQDEWLITPSITLADNETLRFMLQADFFNVYDCTDFDWSAITYPERRVVCNMQVMISADDGNTWTGIWDLANDVASKMTDRECYDASDLVYRKYAVDLSAYANKSVKIAFRYVREEGDWMGNSMILDAVVIDHPGSGFVESINADENAPVEYYNLNGVKVDSNPIPGIYLRRQGQKISKVVVR